MKTMNKPTYDELVEALKEVVVLDGGVYADAEHPITVARAAISNCATEYAKVVWKVEDITSSFNVPENAAKTFLELNEERIEEAMIASGWKIIDEWVNLL